MGSYLVLVLTLWVVVDLPTAVLGEEVHAGKLDDSGQDEEEAHGHEVVQGGGVGHLGQVVPVVETQEAHGEHRGDPCGRTQGRYGQYGMTMLNL